MDPPPIEPPPDVLLKRRTLSRVPWTGFVPAGRQHRVLDAPLGRGLFIGKPDGQGFSQQ